MFANSHKIIAKNIENTIIDKKEIYLDGGALAWGSVAPDIVPKYKFKRHYREESLEYIIREILELIDLSKSLDFYNIDRITMKVFSTKLGIVSHYLTDFVCIPHVERWTFPKNMAKHLKYELKLDKLAESHSFNPNIIKGNIINLDSVESDMYLLVETYILNVFKEYENKLDYSNDLDYALSLNLSLTNFILELSNAYNEEKVKDNLLIEF